MRSSEEDQDLNPREPSVSSSAKTADKHAGTATTSNDTEDTRKTSAPSFDRNESGRGGNELQR